MPWQETSGGSELKLGHYQKTENQDNFIGDLNPILTEGILGVAIFLMTLLIFSIRYQLLIF